MSPETALVAATALHLGFQSVVTVVVYPALSRTPPESWEDAHAAHSRRISVLVVPLYLAVVVACGWVVVAGPVTTGSVLAVVGNGVAMAVTAVVAAPSHGRLGRHGASSGELSRLLAADRVRLVATFVALVAAVSV